MFQVKFTQDFCIMKKRFCVVSLKMAQLLIHNAVK